MSESSVGGGLTLVPFLKRSGVSTGVRVLIGVDPTNISRPRSAAIALRGPPLVGVCLHDRDANVAAERAWEWFRHGISV